MDPTIQNLLVTVVSPQQIIYSGEAKSVSSINSSGTFDLIPEHANFVTIIEDKPIIIRSNKDQRIEFKFPLAIIYINDNVVKIYAQLPLGV